MQKEASNQTHELDVGVTLKPYIQKTASFRRAENLFIIPNGKRKGLAASMRTLAVWLVRTIKRAYETRGLEPPTNVRAHSTMKPGGIMGRIQGVIPRNYLQSRDMVNIWHVPDSL